MIRTFECLKPAPQTPVLWLDHHASKRPRIDLPVFGSKTVIRISSRVSTDRLRQEMLHRIHDLLSVPPSTASLPFSFRTERNPRSFILLLTIATTGAVG